MESRTESECSLGDAHEALDRYRSQLASIDAQQHELQRKDRRFAQVRLILFLVFVSLLTIGSFGDDIPAALWLGWIAFGLFLIAVAANEPVRDRIDELHKHHAVIRRLIARLQRDWDGLATKHLTRQLATIDLPGHQRDVAGDLDLLGRASLFHLVSMAATLPGIRALARWLAGPADAAIAAQRAAAVDSLAPLRDQRLRFYTLARQISESSGDPDQFVGWASGEPWLAKRRWLVSWSHFSALLAIVLIVVLLLRVLGIVPSAVAIVSLIGLGVLAALNLSLTAAMLGPAHGVFAIAMSSRRAVSDYQEIFAAAEWLPVASSEHSSNFLRAIRETLIDGERSASEGMRELQSVARAGSLRQSAGTFLLYLPLQCLALWDVRVLNRLEAWQSLYGSRVASWFDALGNLEALISIAALRDEYPSWCRAEWIDEGQQVLRATAIGHPLLRDQSRVTNDVSVGPAGTILLVTGSNMSGKSTMLRSIGLNASLAAIGAPVCAREFRLPSLELATSIRVSDDVSQGVSFYMAELKRLKSVVDHARSMSRLPSRTCLFLLDEILQGTNSRERQIAVVQVLRHLMNSGAIGAISTHDLELADEPELAAVSRVVHFRETIRPDAAGNEQMTFDYKMRDGVSPTTNALRLLQMVGLGGTHADCNDGETQSDE